MDCLVWWATLVNKDLLESKAAKVLKAIQGYKDFLVSQDVLVLMEMKEEKVTQEDKVPVQRTVNVGSLHLTGLQEGPVNQAIKELQGYLAFLV